MSVLFCDSNCELWHTDAKALGLQVIQMPYNLDGDEYYYDLGENTDFTHFYKRLREKSLPKTSALNEQNYIDYFEPFLAKGENILYLTFSHKLSATFTFMDVAIKKLLEKYPKRKITCYDTKSISVAAGIQVYYAAQLWKKGKSDAEILAFLKEFTPKVGVYFAVDDLNHLKRGGRISPVMATVGSMIGIKPILSIDKNGSLLPIGKVKGRKNAMKELVAKYVQNVSEEPYDVWIVGADCESDLTKLCDMVKEVTPNRVIHRQIVGPVIATHCGPDTLGIIYHSKA